MAFTLATGREVWLGSFHVIPTYLLHNHPTGTVPERVAELVRQLYFPSGVPLHVMMPTGNEALPDSICIARLCSTPISELRDVAVQESYLTVCWFVQSVDARIRDLIDLALPEIEWEQQAHDFFSEW
jgi:hypothetical protein